VKSLVILALLLTFIIGSYAPAPAQEFGVESKKPPALTGSERFTSIDGRFTVALPQQISSFSPISINTPKGRVTAGDSYSWVLDGLQFEIGYMDMPIPIASAEDAKEMIHRGADVILNSAVSKGGTLVSRSDISFAGSVGHEIKVEVPGLVILARFYVIGQRVYQLIASSRKDAQLQASAVKVLDSFKPLTPTDIEAEMRKKIAEATPSPLPQEPVAPKLKSDAEDDGLKGRVKVVAEENEDLSGTWTDGRRKPTHTADYNERGNLTRTVMFDWKGNPFDFTVYGYIDGARVSKSNSIQYEYDPPPMMMPRLAGEPERKSDPRYSSKLAYKYDDKGRLVETLRYWNDGRLGSRTVVSYKDGKRESLSYGLNGELNSKYVETLDEKGNVVEESYFDTKTDTVRTRYSYAYDSFDAQGNWTKKTTSKWVTKDGQEQFAPAYVTYRTITYY